MVKIKIVLIAVQNERQPRNTATIRPESLKDMDAESILRDGNWNLEQST